MSLLGTNVYANPTTPIWGQGGGGTVVPAGSNLTFLGSPNQVLSNASFSSGVPDSITALDASGNNAPFQAGEFRAYDGLGSYVSLGQTTLGLGLRSFYNAGTLQNTFAGFDSGGWDLSNVKSINGTPYVLQPGTSFTYSNYPGGSPLAESPDFTVLNALSFTAPANGKVYVESLGTFVSTVLGGTTVMNFAVNGVEASVEPTKIQGYDSNINFIGMTMYQFPVSAGLTYDISSIAQCSALPPSGADSVVTSSRMFLMFSQQ